MLSNINFLFEVKMFYLYFYGLQISIDIESYIYRNHQLQIFILIRNINIISQYVCKKYKISNKIHKIIIFIFNQIYRYNVQWYAASLRVRKLLLFILQRSIKACTFKIFSGILIASMEGFASVTALQQIIF